MKIFVRRRKISKKNECAIGNPVIGDLNGNVGSGDVWTEIPIKKKKQ